MAQLHPRAEIRKAVAALLLGATAAGVSVAASRVAPWRVADLPAISVYCNEESTVVSQAAPREYERVVALVVEGAVMLDEGVDDAADALALEIEQAMNRDRRLGGKAGDVTLRETELLEAAIGNQPVAVVRLTFDALYHTDGFVTDNIGDFREAGVDYSLAGQQDQNDRARDEIQLEVEP